MRHDGAAGRTGRAAIVPPLIDCPDCGRRRVHEARGLCGGCYKRQAADERGDEWVTCTACGSRVRLRGDGSLGRHRYTRDRGEYLCPQGVLGQVPQPQGRRVTVQVEAIVPMVMSERDFRARAGDVLRRDLEAFVVAVELGEVAS